MIDNTTISLIITGCIAPPSQKWLFIKDPEQRLNQYISSIQFYIKESPFTKIIFCDSSNYAYGNINSLVELAHSNGKQLEWLSFLGNQERVQRYGKGVGEDEIMQYVFAKSRLLRQSKMFCKITGRLKVDNINEIICALKSSNNYFVRDLYRPHNHGLDTRCYLAEIDFFNNRLLNCYNKEHITHTMAFEDVFFTLVEGQYATLPRYPRVKGISAGNCRDYSKESVILFKISNFLCKVGLFKSLFPLYHLFFMIVNKLSYEFGYNRTVKKTSE